MDIGITRPRAADAPTQQIADYHEHDSHLRYVAAGVVAAAGGTAWGAKHALAAHAETSNIRNLEMLERTARPEQPAGLTESQAVDLAMARYGSGGRRSPEILIAGTVDGDWRRTGIAEWLPDGIARDARTAIENVLDDSDGKALVAVQAGDWFVPARLRAGLDPMPMRLRSEPQVSTGFAATSDGLKPTTSVTTVKVPYVPNYDRFSGADEGIRAVVSGPGELLHDLGTPEELEVAAARGARRGHIKKVGLAAAAAAAGVAAIQHWRDDASATMPQVKLWGEELIVGRSPKAVALEVIADENSWLYYSRGDRPIQTAPEPGLDAMEERTKVAWATPG